MHLCFLSYHMSHNGERVNLADAADESPFVRLLETRGRVKILDIFMVHGYTELTQSELAEMADIDQGTVCRNVRVLEDLDVVNEVSETQPYEYRLNLDSPVVSALREAQIKLAPDTAVLKQDDVPRPFHIEHSECVDLEKLEDRLSEDEGDEFSPPSREDTVESVRSTVDLGLEA